MNELNELTSRRARRIAYAAYALLGVALGSVQVGYAAAELGQPVWLTVALAVYAYVGGSFGVVAAGNVPRPVDADSVEEA